MITLIRGTFVDLSGRVMKMISDLTGPGLDEGVDPLFLETTVRMLRELNDHIKEQLDSGDLEIEALIRNNLIKYNTFYERLLTIELFRYLIIINYGAPEAYFKKKIKRIYDEVKCNQILPLVTTISNSENYYWALPDYYIIAVPSGEERNLLNLPDLYHEMGHLIYYQYAEYLSGNFEEAVNAYYNDEILRVVTEQRASSLITFFRDKLSRWLSTWIMEFVCDLIATYLVGPAYAWTNLKISTMGNGEGQVYVDSPSHPSDEARTRAILGMLKKMGHHEEVEPIERSWDQFLTATLNDFPANYDYIFPDTLLEELIERVHQGCRDIGLKCYPEQVEEHRRPISRILNEAWLQVCNHPENFHRWEEEQIEEIRASL